ncbi:TPA: helix-turn-helix domain-containing protein [Vibrio parahaemolyticus]
MTNQALKEHIDSLLKLERELGVTLDNKIVRIDALITPEEGKIIGERLSEARLKHWVHGKSISQRTLADISGINHSIISKMESGVCKHLNNIVQVAQAGRFSIHWLLFGEGFPVHEPIIAGCRYYSVMIEEKLMQLYDWGGARSYLPHEEEIKRIEANLKKATEDIQEIIDKVTPPEDKNSTQ